MKWWLLLVLTGCSLKASNTTIFLKERNTRIYNLSGEECLVSGYYLTNLWGTQYRLVTVFENCDVRHERILDEVELKQWKKTTSQK